MSTWQFVDSIASSPAVRLDLHSMTGGLMLGGEPELSPPQMRRATVSSMLADGDLIPAEAFANRVVKLSLRVLQATTDLAADKLQVLARELSRQPGNILRVTVGSNPVFFRTFPAPDAAYQLLLMAPNRGLVSLEIPCDPFGYGLKETLPAVTVYNDPAEGLTLNSNPYFETDVSGWTPTGGTFVRSTAQFHEGAASGLLTPDGVSSGASAGTTPNSPAVEGLDYWASAWVRCAVARNVSVNINWRTAGGSLISVSTGTVAVAATTWTLVQVSGTAPATTAQLTMSVSMSSTPPASNTLHVDEARVRQIGGPGGMYLDIAAPKGDVETPLSLTVGGTVGTGGGGSGGQIATGIAVRRRGTPSAAPLVLQAEAMTQGTNTTTQANSPLMSGPTGNNYSRCTFGSPGMLDRLSTVTRFPAVASNDARGRYRVYARVRQTVGTDVIDMRLLWGSTAVQVTNATTRLPADTGAGAPTIKYVDLDVVQIPVGYDPVTDGLTGVELATEGLFLKLQAQRVSGSGSLDVDLLLFWPVDDRASLTSFPAVQNTPSDVFVVDGGPEPAAYCLGASGQIVSTAPVQISGTGAMLTPGRANRIYVARDLGTSTSTAPAGAGDQITGTLTVVPSYMPRYVFPLKPVST